MAAILYTTEPNFCEMRTSLITTTIHQLHITKRKRYATAQKCEWPAWPASYKYDLFSFLLLSGTNGYTYSNSSFLFSLRNKDNIAPFIASIKQGKENAALYPASGFGPWFGCNDILIHGNSNRNQKSYCNFGAAYQLPPGYIQGTGEAWNLLAGESYFSTSEIEIFC